MKNERLMSMLSSRITCPSVYLLSMVSTKNSLFEYKTLIKQTIGDHSLKKNNGLFDLPAVASRRNKIMLRRLMRFILQEGEVA